jgi:hypothetical protein
LAIEEESPIRTLELVSREMKTGMMVLDSKKASAAE